MSEAKDSTTSSMGPGSSSEKDAVHMEDVGCAESVHHNNPVGHDAAGLTGYWKSYRLLGSLLAIVLLGNNLFIGYSMPVNILSVINGDIGPSPNIYLVTMCFTLVSGVLLLVVGRISDIVGRRYFMIGGQAFAVIGSIVAAKANSIETVIGGTVLMAVAGAGQQLYPLLVQELVPNKHRGLAQGAISIGVLPTLGFGPAIARSFVESGAGWRWCYWLNAIAGGVSLILFASCYFPPDFHMINSDMTRMQELKELDYGGLILYSAGLVLVVLAFLWGEGTYPWDSAHVIATLVIGGLTLIGFGVYETYMPLKQPLLPVKLLKIRNLVACVIVGSVGQMVWYALNVLWPTQITQFYTTDNILVGIMSSTTGVALACGEFIFSPLLRLVGKPRWQLVLSSIGTALFCCLMGLNNQNTKGFALACTILSGLSVGWIELVATVVVGLVVPPEDIGVAQGFFASTRAVTGTVATSIYICIYSNRLSTFLPEDVIPAVEKAGLPSSSTTQLLEAVAQGVTSAIDKVPGMTDAIKAALDLATKHAYARAFKIVYLSSLGFAGLAVIAAFFVSDVDKYMTNFVNKTVDRSQAPGREKSSDDGTTAV
ncbi:hypothetical protein FE257_009735 [Aspergillus nanangensis]|uniref:Major facilitator superfamily (MFS) profile domain-containing protein n=1 Tax=Aspergillus nanangensis TaxID=2582783 RepID=A0AAD4CL76_ASPNN|nr:hypothetical protein FE257_009735 [Aspergillus nanangensis]